jgi:hypothetical protein
LSPTLFGLYIDKLEEWLNFQEGDGALLGEFMIRLLLYADNLILIAKSALGLKEHLISLEHFCSTVGMQVNTSKTKVVVFSSKRKHNQHKFYFEGSTLEEVADYKYLGIDFNKNLSWEGCRRKELWEVGKRSMLSKIGAERQSYGIGRLCKLSLGF